MRKQFTWKEFLKFRNMTGMPSISEDITCGNSDANLKGKFSDLKVKDTAKLTYSWGTDENILYERLSFHHGSTFSLKSPMNELEKLFFLTTWFEENDVMFWGYLNGEVSDLKIEKMGWALLEDIQEYIMKTNNLDPYNQKEEEVLWSSGGRYDTYMQQSFDYRGDSPKVRFYYINGGVYFAQFEPMEREKPMFSFMKDKEVSEEREKEMEANLKKYALQVKEFLKEHQVRIDPNRGVIKLNEEK